MILHVNNTAGVASVLAKYQRRRETSLVISPGDPYGHFSSYGGVIRPVVIRQRSIMYYVLVGLLGSRSRVVHVHGSLGSAKNLRTILDRLGKRRIVEYHGYLAIEREKGLDVESMPDTRVIVSTPNLLAYFRDAEWLPNPVDTELFYDFRLPNFRLERGLTFIKYRREHMLKYLSPYIAQIERDYDIEIDVHICRSKNDIIPHRQMAELFNHYEFYIDLQHGYDKEHTILELYSLMGLQALACGCKVITTWDGMKKGLPEIHRADNVVNRLEKIIQET